MLILDIMNTSVFETNTIWYKNVYTSLIDKAKATIFSKECFLEKHHILPRCLGGTDDCENIVLVPIKWHVTLHLLLARIYNNNSSLLLTAYLMTKSRSGIKTTVRVSAWLRESFMKGQVGKTLTEDQKRSCGHGPLDDEYKKRISETLKARGKENNTNARKVKAEGIIFDSVTEAANFYKISEALMGRWCKDPLKPEFTYASPKAQKRVQGPDGTVYNSIRELSRKTGHPRKTLRNWLNNYPHMGYKYLE